MQSGSKVSVELRGPARVQINPDYSFGAITGAVAMPVRELCDAAYCHQVQIRAQASVHYILIQYSCSIDQQICEQRHLKSNPGQRLTFCRGFRTIFRIQYQRVILFLFSLVYLSKHQFGNYVIQSMINRLPKEQKLPLKASLK